MYPTSPFLLRRVLLGVVVGLALLAVGFFGWTRYRVGQYHHRESSVLAVYHAQYRGCLADGTSASACAGWVYAACLSNPFWRAAEPFSFGGGFGTGGSSEAPLQCRSTTG